MVPELIISDHFIMYKNVESQCCTPETNTISYINHNSNLKKIIPPVILVGSQS